MYGSLCLCAGLSCVCSWSFGLRSHKCVKNRNWVAPPSCHTSGIFTTEINLSSFKKQIVREWLLLRLPTDIKIVFILKGDDGTWYRTKAVSSPLCFNVVNFLFFLCFVDSESRYICVIQTNLMHYLSSVYFVNQRLHVSGIFVAHRQEVYCIYATIGTCYAEKRDV